MLKNTSCKQLVRMGASLLAMPSKDEQNLVPYEFWSIFNFAHQNERPCGVVFVLLSIKLRAAARVSYHDFPGIYLYLLQIHHER